MPWEWAALAARRKPRRLAFARVAFRLGQREGPALSLIDWERDHREPEVDEERDQSGDRLELSDLDRVPGGSGSGGDELLLDALVADSPQNPKTMPNRVFPVGIFHADNFDVISGFNEVLESCFCNHIRRFFC